MLGFKCTQFIEEETCTEQIRQKRNKKGLNKEVDLGMFQPCSGLGRPWGKKGTTGLTSLKRGDWAVVPMPPTADGGFFPLEMTS